LINSVAVRQPGGDARPVTSPTHLHVIPSPRGNSDVIVIGDGIVGLSVAHALAARGISTHVIGERLPGAASSAAAGLLSPSGGSVPEDVRAFMVAARDVYPSFITRLAHDTGRTIPLNRLGILEIALDDAELAALESSRRSGTELLSRESLARIEPALAQASGAVIHEDDGCVDNRAVLGALDEWASHSSLVRRSVALVRSLEPERRAVVTASGDRFDGGDLVLAAGAWSSGIFGLPRQLPVSALRGQMLAVDGQPLRHSVMGTCGYLVPREGYVLVGSTLEPGSYDSQPVSTDIEALRGALRRLCPALGDAPERARWAGVRPATPDMLPVIGRDPRVRSLIYACGHAKNGILLGPLTGECVADIVAGAPTRLDIEPFAVSRFDGDRLR
jgi:glycine oxidase